MALPNPSDDSEVKPRIKACVQTAYKNNPELATKAYHRKHNYRDETATHLEEQYNISVTTQQIHNATLKLSRLGLLSEYATIE